MSAEATPQWLLLIRATLRIYQAALVDAFKGTAMNWRLVFFHFGLSIALAIAAYILSAAGVLGGFMLGLMLAVGLGMFFATVEAAVEQEVLHFHEIWPRGLQLFSPILSVLFALFILELFCELALSGPELDWIQRSLNLIITVLFNPLPEISYQRPSAMGEMFGDAMEFIKENFIEWLLPFVLLLVPIALMSWESALAILITTTTTNPFRMLQFVLLNLAAVGARLAFGLQGIVLLLLFVYLLYYVFAFRGALFKRLAGSSRRKRIYQERLGRS